MDRTVTRLNIDYLVKRLADEADVGRRHMIARLIAEEEAKLPKPDVSEKQTSA